MHKLKRLSDLLLSPKVKKKLLAGYEGRYALSVTPQVVHLYVEVKGDHEFPHAIALEGHRFPVVVWEGYGVSLAWAGVLGRKYR